MKHIGIILRGYTLKDGKLGPKPKRMSVSERLRQKHSKRTKSVGGRRFP